MRVVLLAAALLLLVLVSSASDVSAEGVVTSCTDQNLRRALVGGGLVTMRCNGIIALRDELVIEADTTIDGDSWDVTISGGGAVRVFNVTPGTTLNLRQITIADGHATNGGGIFVSDCYVSCGDTTIVIDDSVFSGNSAHWWGGGLYVMTHCQEDCGHVTVEITDSDFVANSAGRTGSVFYHDSDSYPQHFAMTIRNSTLEQNTGDVILLGNSADLTVQDSTLSNNTGDVIRTEVYASASATVRGSVFEDNSGSGVNLIEWGGLDVVDSVFRGNGSCGIRGWDSWLSVRDSTFVDNSYCGLMSGDDGGVATVVNSTFSNNGDAGFDIVGGGQATVTVANSTLAANGGSNVGGILAGYESTVRVINSTLYGVPVINQLPEGAIVLSNTIVAGSSTGVNCTGPITDGGGNLSYPDATCPGINADPLLGPLQDNGGSTLTMAPLPGSPAIDGGVDATCLTAPISGLDQRWMMRPIGPHCDIGAVEFASVMPWRRWLPVVLVE